MGSTNHPKFTGGKPKKAARVNPVHMFRMVNLDAFLRTKELSAVDLARRVWGPDVDGSFIGQMRRGEKLISEDNAHAIEQAIGYTAKRQPGWMSADPTVYAKAGLVLDEDVVAKPAVARVAGDVIELPAANGHDVRVKTKAEAWAAVTATLLRLSTEKGLHVPEDRYDKVVSVIVRRSLKEGRVSYSEVADLVELLS